MHVCLDPEPLCRMPSGIGWYTVRILRELARLPDRVRPHLCYATLRPGPARAVRRACAAHGLAVPFHVLPLPGRLAGCLPAALARRLLMPPLRTASLFHATGFLRPPWQPDYGLPTVLTIYDLAFLRETRENFGPPRYTAMLREQLPAAAAEAAAILTISEFTRREIQALLGVPEERIFVSHLGTQWEGLAPPAADATADAAALAHHGLTSAGYLLSVGLLSPRKNFGALVKAVAMAREQHPDLRLVIVGRPGWDCDDLVRELTAGHPGLTWIQELPTAELHSLYRHARAFALVSWYEGFGIPVLEAMQAGCPVCVSTADALVEVAGDAALVVRPDDAAGIRDALACLWRDAARRQELAEKGRRRANLFSWRRTAEVTLDAYACAARVRPASHNQLRASARNRRDATC
jgi:glycosyltransferase involved in cell wall biosynthesis